MFKSLNIRSLLVQKIFFALGFLLLCQAILAQRNTISGIVKDERSTPLYGALIKIEGQSDSTYTDTNGKFSINISDPSPKLIISHPGMQTKALSVISSESIEIVLFSNRSQKLFDMSMEDLMNVKITSVSKKPEHLQDVPSSIYVITSEDIARSSAQNLMHLLRDNVPGFWAAQNDYKIVDGFIRDVNEGSVLILLDGTPILDVNSFNLDYESFDIPFNQIEKIEVIKGSGGTIYGANSASGIISIFTKNPEDQDKLFVSADYATPGKLDVNLIGSPVQNEKLSATIYAKANSFSGFEQMPEIENESSIVPKLREDGDTLIYNRYTGDDRSFKSVNAGYSIKYIVSEDLKLSTNLNIVRTNTNNYRQSFAREDGTFHMLNGELRPASKDSVFLAENNKTRITGNIRADYKFNESHNIFARLSSNIENGDKVFSGGYHSDNSIYDIEIQDNINFGFNSLSVGANYRLVNNKVSLYPTSNISFINPNSTENLTGIFAQDKISLLDGKLNLYLGAKAENFSLINDKYYFSPMAKVSFIPSKSLTIWGGFTQSYTTPGFNLTNIELDIFKAYSTELYPYYYVGVENEVFNDVYNTTLAMGTDSITAAANAQGFINSSSGQQIVDSLTNAQLNSEYPNGHVTTAAINSSNTEPTSFKNYEFGIRFSPFKKISVESNFFYSIVKDGVGSSNVGINVESPTRPGEIISAYYYGNYLKGTNMGLESIVRIKAMQKLMLELSYSFFSYTLEYQKNDDFDIEGLKYDSYNNGKYPILPKHTIRLKSYFDLSDDLKISFSAIYSSKYFIRSANIIPYYQYQEQRFDPIYGDGGNQSLIGGEFDNRFILNFRIDKYFIDGKLDVFVYGCDAAAGTFVEGVNQLDTVYPRQVGSMFGGGITYNF